MLRRWRLPLLYFSALFSCLAWLGDSNSLSAPQLYVLLLLGTAPYALIALIARLLRRRQARKTPGQPQKPDLPLPFGFLALMGALLLPLSSGWLPGLGFLLLTAIGLALRGLIRGIRLALRRRRKPSRRPVPLTAAAMEPASLPAASAHPATDPIPAAPRPVGLRRRSWRWVGLMLLAVVGTAALGWGLRPSVRVPEDIAAFVARYPEAQAFAGRYAAEHGRAHDMSVNAECAEAAIPLFVQWDARWGYELYGGNYLGVNGCGPTCMAMVACGLTGDTCWNPYEMACFADREGYYVPGNGTSWDFMTDGARQLGLEAKKGEITREYILENLSPSTPMICSMRPGDFTTGGHYIVLTGLDAADNILVNDPNSPEKSARSWDVNVLIPQIKGIWRYQA